ncbi:site-specific integrase [Gordonia terrae]|uniref:Site-specific integrase n=3 Tax=Gordonia terrae TaxID=2055 RepID=A0AAD0KEM6_9ACTN|nr:recombinase XerD [Gordonia terrae]AWO85152.1 site-specific integrase [Gordonia terrae]GAB46784.1 putative site-specific recombinase [Gordonia terrae NBRC 100016]VTR10864.1 DNA integration/recombination/invertion protein [Clostridioides difficile]VTS58819.1 site-specific tyrosine recombinase XerC [Gordonia terrae]
MTENQRQRGHRADNSVRPNMATVTVNGQKKNVQKGWRARPTLGTDPVTGKQVRPTKVFPTKKAAQEWVDEQREQWRGRTWAAKSDRTFDDVADHWIKIREADDRVRENTVRADRESLAYARRTFGQVAVQKLTPEALTEWSLTMTTKHGTNADGTPRPGKALAPSTKRRAIVSVKSVMAHAVTMKWIPYDPSAHLQAPEQKVIVAVAEGDIWTPAQMTEFLDYVADHRLSGCFALTLLGLRREEVGGLRWCDLDLEAGELRIRQARVDVNGREVIADPKNSRSVRDLPVPPRELAMLKAMRTHHLRERLAVGRPLVEEDLLLSRIDGTPLPVREYTRLFTDRRKAAKLPPITLRNLRHSSVSRMRAAGVPADVVAAWHGHSERMTQAVYGRVTDDRLAAAAVVLSNAVGQS